MCINFWIMKELLIILCVSVIIAACSSPYERNANKMASQVEDYMKELAFKSNSNLLIYELDVVKYDTVDENYLDLAERVRINEVISRFERQQEETKAAMNDAGDEMMRYAVFGLQNPLYKSAEKEMLKYRDQGLAIIDSIYHYLDQDSIIEIRIKERTHPKPYYLAYTFVKAKSVENNTGKSFNLLDTVEMLFDEKFELVIK